VTALLLQLALFAAGVALLVAGAWLLVSGGTRVAAVLGVPAVVVGLTVVAFGTSAPELFVSLVGALRGNTGLALGNVVGSNVANIGLILALAALVQPVRVERGLPRREVPLLVGVSVLFAALVWDGTLGTLDAAVLVAGFVAFIAWTIGGSRRGEAIIPEAPQVAVVPGHRVRQFLIGTGSVVVGVVGLAAGGQMIVNAALALATAFSVSETVIGLTLVAVGTSLPELATTIVAAWRREDDLALGNIVGSNLFNILAVAGPVGLVAPLAETSGRHQGQLASMVALAVMLFLIVRFGGDHIGRGSGLVLLLVYAAIMVSWTLAG
jgi:cation:H+ antiporter